MSNIHPSAQDDPVQSLLVAADKAALSRDFLKSVELLEEAARRSPRNPNVLFLLGNMQGKQYDYAGAEKSFERAIEAAPHAGEALIQAGRNCLVMGKKTLARKYFTRAVELPNPHPLAFTGMADVLWWQDKFPEATDFVDRALRLDPACPTALLLRARLLARSGDWPDAELILTRLAEDSDRKLMLRVAAGCDLARVLDQQKKYDAAMAAVVKAKALFKPPAHIAQGFANLSHRRRVLEEAGLAKKLEKWFQPEEPPVPMVCAGGRSYASDKIGIEERFAAHEEIFYLEESRVFLDEVHFPARRRFPRETPLVTVYDSLTPDMLREMRSVYLKRNEVFLQQPIGGRVIVEKSHILNSLLLARIRVFPEARLLMLLRDPRDACLESFMQFHPINPCSTGFLTLAGSVTENVDTMNHWRNVMGIAGKPHMQVRLEDMMTRSDLTTGQVFSFLKVKPVADASLKTPAPSWGLGNWENYRKYLEPYLPELNNLARDLGY